jgi:hypothetical protein
MSLNPFCPMTDQLIERTEVVALLFNVSEIVSAPAQVWPPRRGRVLQDGPELSILVCLSTRIMSLLGSAARAETLQPGSSPEPGCGSVAWAERYVPLRPMISIR